MRGRSVVEREDFLDGLILLLLLLALFAGGCCYQLREASAETQRFDVQHGLQPGTVR